jgi:hypothetical protein
LRAVRRLQTLGHNRSRAPVDGFVCEVMTVLVGIHDCNKKIVSLTVFPHSAAGLKINFIGANHFGVGKNIT